MQKQHAGSRRFLKCEGGTATRTKAPHYSRRALKIDWSTFRILNKVAVVVGVTASRRTGVFTATAAVAPTDANGLTNGAEPDRSAETTPRVRSAHVHAIPISEVRNGWKAVICQRRSGKVMAFPADLIGESLFLQPCGQTPKIFW